MLGDRELDAYADAALVAILRLLVVRGERLYDGDHPPFDGVLTREGVEAVDDLVRRCQRLPLFDVSPRSTSGVEGTYLDHRRAIDPLWRYVEEYGVELLLREIAERSPRHLR